jgi:hypothetical protein
MRVVLTACVLSVTLAACDSSTAPNPTPVASAEFFDSIYAADLAAGTRADSADAMQIALLLEIPAAYGGQQTTFEVTTAAGLQIWHGFAWEFVFGGDSAIYLTAYDDHATAHIISFQDFLAVQQEFSGYLIAFSNVGPTEINAVTATARASATPGTVQCSLQSGLQAGGWISQVLTAFVGGSFTCTTAAFTINSTLGFSPTSNLGALQSWSSGTTTFTGPRLLVVDPSPAVLPRRLPRE